MTTDEVLPGFIAILNAISQLRFKNRCAGIPSAMSANTSWRVSSCRYFFTNDINTDGDSNKDGDANIDGDDGENTEESFYLQVADVRT